MSFPFGLKSTTNKIRGARQEALSCAPVVSFLLIALILSVSGAAAASEIQFFGDVLLSRGIDELFSHEGIGSVWKGVDTFFVRGAVNVVNLEGAVGSPSHCARGRTPCFSIRRASLPVLSVFDVIGFANNHSLDVGVGGLKNTIKEVRNQGAVPLGAQDFYHIIETTDGNIAVLALTDIVNSGRDREIHSPPDSPRVFEAIGWLKSKATVIAVFIHWGRELDTLPTERMRALAEQFIHAGADIVVGHHSHVAGKVQCVEGRPVVYSLGNFLFDQKYEETKTGTVLSCNMNENDMLFCSLAGVRAPMNSFIPHVIDTAPTFLEENKILSACTPELIRKWTGIFTRDGRKKKLIMTKVPGQSGLSYLELYDDRSGRRLVKSPSMPIQKLQTIDVNGDGIQEIMLIMNVYSSLDNEVAKRVYIYSLDGGFKALWRGSALSRPLLDATFIRNPRDGKPTLIALHTSDSFLVRNPKKPERVVMSYRWNGFGFAGLKEKRLVLSVDHLSTKKGKIMLMDNKGIIAGELADTDFN